MGSINTRSLWKLPKTAQVLFIDPIPEGDVSSAPAWAGGLGYTAENVANKGVANGYASLDSGGKVPLSQLPAGVGGDSEVLAWMGF